MTISGFGRQQAPFDHMLRAPQVRPSAGAVPPTHARSRTRVRSQCALMPSSVVGPSPLSSGASSVRRAAPLSQALCLYGPAFFDLAGFHQQEMILLIRAIVV